MNLMSNLIKLKIMKPKQFTGLSLALVIALLSTNVNAQENEK